MPYECLNNLLIEMTTGSMDPFGEHFFSESFHRHRKVDSATVVSGMCDVVCKPNPAERKEKKTDLSITCAPQYIVSG